MKDRLNITKKQLIIAFCIFSGTIITISLIILIPRIGKTATTIKYAPYIANVFINDEQTKNNNVIYLAPGNYNIRVELEGFETLNTSCMVTETPSDCSGLMTSNSELGDKILTEHQKDLDDLEKITVESLEKQASFTQEKWPALNYLPYTDSLFSLGYLFDYDQNNIPSDIKITINSTDDYIGLALYTLTQLIKEDSLNYNYYFYTDIIDFSQQQINSVETTPELFVKQSYPKTPINTVIGTEYILDNIKYYYGFFKVENSNISYRFVLKKDSQTWNILSTPYPLLTYKNSPNIPKEILLLVNDIQ